MRAAGAFELHKDDDEHPVPANLQVTFREIVSAFVEGDFLLSRHPVEGVAPVEPDVAKAIAHNILAYGDSLALLDDATWERSCYRWMDGYWVVLVDLTTEGETVSDLTCHAKLYDVPSSVMEIWSVHVP